MSIHTAMKVMSYFKQSVNGIDTNTL